MSRSVDEIGEVHLGASEFIRSVIQIPKDPVIDPTVDNWGPRLEIAKPLNPR